MAASLDPQPDRELARAADPVSEGDADIRNLVWLRDHRLVAISE